MLESAPKFFDTRTIIVNLLKEDREIYLSINRLHKLLNFIYLELKEKCKLDEYQISFDINFDAIERTVLYNTNIFVLDIDEEKIYLREPQSIDKLAQQYKVDETVGTIIKDFKLRNVA